MSGQLKMGVTSVSVGINYLRIYSVKVMCVCVCVSVFFEWGGTITVCFLKWVSCCVSKPKSIKPNLDWCCFDKMVDKENPRF